MKLNVITPTEEVVSTTVDSVVLPGVVGEMEILPQHTYLISTLQIGVITYRVGNQKSQIEVGEGHVEVADDEITCLVETAKSINTTR